MSHNQNQIECLFSTKKQGLDGLFTCLLLFLCTSYLQWRDHICGHFYLMYAIHRLVLDTAPRLIRISSLVLPFEGSFLFQLLLSTWVDCKIIIMLLSCFQRLSPVIPVDFCMSATRYMGLYFIRFFWWRSILGLGFLHFLTSCHSLDHVVLENG